MARSKRHKGAVRDPGGFAAIPWAVLDSKAYLGLSHPARSLLLEFARQCHGDDNGRMVATLAHLQARGWNSKDVITRAKRELLDASLIFETCKGRRPNRASRYAVTWLGLDKIDGFDEGATTAFRRGAYRDADYAPKNAYLSPSNGVESHPIGP
jgi:hypothetical protein